MNTTITKRLVSAIVLVAAAGAVQAAFAADAGSYQGYAQGAARSGDARDPFVDGARAVDPYLDGARIEERSVFTDGARTLAGLDRAGVSADPARAIDPYLDGARTGERSVFTDGARTLAGLDRTGVSADPARAIAPYLDGARIGERSVFTDGAYS